MEWGAIALGIIIGYRLIRRKFRGFRLESGDAGEYEEDREEDREDRTYRYDTGSGEYRENRSAAADFTRSMSGSSDAREVDEAIWAGERALDSLREAKAKLNSARNWGIYDILGGGMISSMVKHSKMSSANEWVEQANRDLKRFAKELRDVDEDGLYVQAGSLASTLDIFFDNVFSDFIVQNRINEARGEIDRMIDRIERTVWDLKNRYGR